MVLVVEVEAEVEAEVGLPGVDCGVFKVHHERGERGTPPPPPSEEQQTRGTPHRTIRRNRTLKAFIN